MGPGNPSTHRCNSNCPPTHRGSQTSQVPLSPLLEAASAVACENREISARFRPLLTLRGVKKGQPGF